MSHKFKVGDQVVHRVGGKTVTVAAVLNPRGGLNIVIESIAGYYLRSSEDYELVPPVFEVGKTYRHMQGASLYTVVDKKEGRVIGWANHSIQWTPNDMERPLYRELPELP